MTPFLHDFLLIFFLEVVTLPTACNPDGRGRPPGLSSPGDSLIQLLRLQEQGQSYANVHWLTRREKYK